MLASSVAVTTAGATEYPKALTCHEVTSLLDSGPSGLNIGNSTSPIFLGVYRTTSGVSVAPSAPAVSPAASNYADGWYGCTTCPDNKGPVVGTCSTAPSSLLPPPGSHRD